MRQVLVAHLVGQLQGGGGNRVEAVHKDCGLQVVGQALQLRQVLGVAGCVHRGIWQVEERHSRATGVGDNQLVQRLHKVLWNLSTGESERKEWHINSCDHVFYASRIVMSALLTGKCNVDLTPPAIYSINPCVKHCSVL